MTRWHGTTNADRILADRGADRARGFGRADLAGDVRNRSWRGPSEFCSSVSQTRTSKSVPISTTRSGRLARHSFGSKMRCAIGAVRRGVLDIARLRPAPRMSASAALLLAVVGEREPASPRSRRHHQRRAERRGVEAVADRQPFAAGFPFARRHRLVRDEQVVQPSRARQPDLIGGVEHARGIAQQCARAVERERLQKRLRRQPGPAAEQVMQFGRRDAGRFRDGLDLRLAAPMAADM